MLALQLVTVFLVALLVSSLGLLYTTYRRYRRGGYINKPTYWKLFLVYARYWLLGHLTLDFIVLVLFVVALHIHITNEPRVFDTSLIAALLIGGITEVFIYFFWPVRP